MKMKDSICTRSKTNQFKGVASERVKIRRILSQVKKKREIWGRIGNNVTGGSEIKSCLDISFRGMST